MVDRVNLADPEAEPSDAQLAGLSARAFAGVSRAHELALERLRSAIAEARQSVLLDLAERRSP
ncbi:MAG TPA: hypothetical protein VLT33_24230, partial [Labilithrix sp.]|nr:hypothetical protein [Labilithrix sp.]